MYDVVSNVRVCQNVFWNVVIVHVIVFSFSSVKPEMFNNLCFRDNVCSATSMRLLRFSQFY